MKGICCIVDADESYALHLTECLNSVGLLPFSIRTYSDIAAFRGDSEELAVELLIIAEELVAETDLSVTERVIVLSESCARETEEGFPCVMKYQAVDKVIREIAALYEDMSQESLVLREEKEVSFIGVYSPNGSCYKTTFCLMLAYILGRRQKVLYVNLEEFSALGEVLQEGQYNLSDALYYYHIGERSVKLMSVINEGNEFDYISPVSAAEDLAYFTVEVLLGLIDRLVQLGGYETVIFDMGSFIKQPWRLLAQMDRIYTPKPRSRHEERRLMEFKKYMHNTGQGSQADNMIETSLPYDETINREGRLNFLKAVNGGLGRVVQELGI